MTDKQRVFCGGCRWYKESKNPHIDIRCIHACYFGSEEMADYHPVLGEVKHTTSTANCMDKNANCDCPDYTPKEATDDTQTTDPNV